MEWAYRLTQKSGEEILLESSLGSSEQDKKMKQIVGTKKTIRTRYCKKLCDS